MLIEIISNITFVTGLLLVIGLALMAAEFLTPGFGIFGISGIILLVIFVITAARTPLQLIVLLILLFLLLSVMFIVAVTVVSKKRLPKSIRLDDTMQDSLAAENGREDLIGKLGEAVTILRPCGRAKIEGNIYEVMTGGEFVDKGERISVIKVEGGKITVQKSN